MARCDWHVGDLDLPDDADPLQDIAVLTATARVIDLTTTEPELIGELDRLIDREARYFEYAKDDDGVAPLGCELKWSRQHILTSPSGSLNCFNCPHHVGDKASAKSLICALGREQHNIVEQIRGIRVADDLEAELVAHYSRDIEESAELAEHWLSTA